MGDKLEMLRQVIVLIAVVVLIISSVSIYNKYQAHQQVVGSLEKEIEQDKIELAEIREDIRQQELALYSDIKGQKYIGNSMIAWHSL